MKEIILCKENLEPHQKSGKNAEINQSWLTTPTWPLVTFWFISANYLKNKAYNQTALEGLWLIGGA